MLVKEPGAVPYRTLNVTLVLEPTKVSHRVGVNSPFSLGPNTVAAAGLTITQVKALSTGEPDAPVFVFIVPSDSLTKTSFDVPPEGRLVAEKLVLVSARFGVYSVSVAVS